MKNVCRQIFGQNWEKELCKLDSKKCINVSYALFEFEISVEKHLNNETGK